MSDRPILAYANPRPEESYRFYLNGKLAVRETNDGTVYVKAGDRDWIPADEIYGGISSAEGGD